MAFFEYREDTQQDFQQGTLAEVRAIPTGALELLEFLQLSFSMVSAANAYLYVDMTSVTDYVTQTGDYLEYDVFWPADAPIIKRIAVDLTFSDGTNLRDSGATDQNGLSAHPNTDLSAYASGQWYHRKIQIPSTRIGKTIVNYDLACEYDGGGTVVGYIRNINITDGAGNIRKAIWNVGDALPTLAVHLTSNTSQTYSFTKRYPSSGYRLSPVIDISSVGIAGPTLISWGFSAPASTSITLETNVSLDGGLTWQGWQVATNGQPIPGIAWGTDLSNARLQIRETLSTTDTTVTPALLDLLVRFGAVSELPTSGIVPHSGELTGTYTVIPVGFSGMPSGGTVHEHRSLPSQGGISATGELTGTYTVIERPKVTTALSPIRDAFVWDKEPRLNYGDVQDIAVGRSGGYLARGLVQFDVSTLRTDLIILSAVLRLRCRFSGTGEIGVYPLLGPFDELGVTWANQPAAVPTPDATAPAPTQVGAAVDFEITDLFLGWYQGTRTNYGIGLRVTDETTMAATLVGAREAGTEWQAQLLVTYYEPDAIPAQSDLPSTGHVGRTETADLVSVGDVDAALHQDPCSAPEDLLWQGPYANLTDSPYPPSVPPPGMPSALELAYVRPACEGGGVIRFWGTYQGYPAFILVDAMVCGRTELADLSELYNRPNRYRVQAWIRWYDVAINTTTTPSDSPYDGHPWYVTGWLGRISPNVGFIPWYAVSWYLHAFVYPPAVSPCGLSTQGTVSRRDLLSSGMALQVSSLPSTAFVRGPEHQDLVTLGRSSRPDIPSTGIPRLSATDDLASTGFVPFASDLPTQGSPRVVGDDDLASAGYVAHAPNEISTTGTVRWTSDLPSAGSVGAAPNQLPTTGTPRVPGTSDLPTTGYPNTPYLRSLGIVHQYSDLFSLGSVRVHADLPTTGFMAYRDASDLPSTGIPRIRAASDLPSTGLARGGHSDLGSRGIVTAIVLELHVDLSAWPPEGRSTFPG